MSNKPSLDLVKKNSASGEGERSKSETGMKFKIKTAPPSPLSKKKHRFLFLKIFGVLLILTALAGSIFSYKVLSVEQDIFVEDDNKTSFVDQIKKLVLADNKQLKGEPEGRTNILLLGMGGEGHTGALLTDTIMIASIRHQKNSSKKEVALLSLPRDLYVPTGVKHYRKINSLYSLGENQSENQGAVSVSNKISEITGIPIHYYIRADFEGFKKVIDSLGGIEVNVETGFKDTEYPTYNFGWQTVVFHQGLQKMDGEKALQFARSRHGYVIEGTGFEGSDFARAKRQQKILEAVKTKVFTINTAVNLKILNDLLSALGDHVRTNVEPWEAMIMLEIAKDLDKGTVINKVIDNSENGLLYSASRGGAYVLLPNVKDFSEIQNYVSNIFGLQDIEKERAAIYVLNGTKNENLAKHTADRLKEEGYNILGFDSAAKEDYENTVIFSSSETNKTTLKNLKDKFKATVDFKSRDFSSLAKKTMPADAAIVIVIGQSYLRLQENEPGSDVIFDEN